jgi:hypothetical protein
VHWHYPSSWSTDKAVASRYSNGGTLISLPNMTKAKCIQDFFLIPTEREFFADFRATLEVKIALTCEEAGAASQCVCAGSSCAQDPVSLVMFAQ